MTIHLTQNNGQFCAFVKSAKLGGFGKSPADALEDLATVIRRAPSRVVVPGSCSRRLLRDPNRGFSRREWDVLECVLSGWSYKETAAELGIALSTVKGHLNSIFCVANVDSLNGLQVWAVERGWPVSTARTETD